MDKLEYAELLRSNEWQAKCCTILERDNYTCCDCGCIGVHNGSFFKISDINDVNKFLPHKLTFDGKDLKDFCEDVKWMNTYEYRSDRSKSEKLDSVYINKFRHPRGCMQIHRFVSDNPLTDCDLDINESCKPDCCYANTDLNCNFYAFCFDMDLGETNYAVFGYENNVFENLFEIDETLYIDIYFAGKYYSFYLSNRRSLLDLIKESRLYSSLDKKEKQNIYFEELRLSSFFDKIDDGKAYIIEKLQLFKFKTLNIHHEYYLLGKKPWEYSNDALVTLCSECHQKRHLHQKTPIYEVINNDRKISCYARLCKKCNGTGYLPQYSYYCDGICFGCNGEGVVF